MLRAPLALLALLLPQTAAAALFHLKGPAPASAHRRSRLRKRLHVNTLITEPGTMDIEWGSAFSTGGSFTFPTAIHYTPEGPYVWWGRTEFMVSFDSLSYNEVNHFGDRITGRRHLRGPRWRQVGYCDRPAGFATCCAAIRVRAPASPALRATMWAEAARA